MPIEEIRELVKENGKVHIEESRPTDKLFKLFSTVGLVLGLVVYMCTFGILFGFIVFFLWGAKKMALAVRRIFKKGNNTEIKGDIINLNKEG